MTIGTIMILLYWALFTVRHGWEPKVNQRIRAKKFDLKQCTSEELAGVRRSMYPLQAARGALCVAHWVENALLVAVAAWCFWVLGALVTGTFVVLGKPI